MNITKSIILIAVLISLPAFSAEKAAPELNRCMKAAMNAQLDCMNIKDGLRKHRCEYRAIVQANCDYPTWGSSCGTGRKSEISRCTIVNLNAQLDCDETRNPERRQRCISETVLHCGC